MGAIWRGIGERILARFFGSDALVLTGGASDSTVMQSGYVNLLANTDTVVAIPVGTVGVHVYHTLASPVFYAVDAVVTVPAGADRTVCGFFPPNQESARVLTNDVFEAGHELHLRCFDGGDVLVEFWG